jgi:hypothetical protein
LLEQGCQESFIAEVLATEDAASLAVLLAHRLPDHPERVRLLAKYLKRVVVKTIRLDDFRPSQALTEKRDIERVVRDFRPFLGAAVDDDGANQRTI